MAEIAEKQRKGQHTHHRMHPNSLANLEVWKGKASSPNPFGRPKKDVSLTSLAKVLLETPTKEMPFDMNNLTWGQALAISWVKRALTSPPMFDSLLERIEGRVPQGIDLTLNLRAEAERVAQEFGLETEEVLREAEAIVKDRGKVAG